MKRGFAALLLALGLSGCISLGSAPPGKTVVVAPQGSTVTCSNGTAPPCQ
ncbi:MAG TPA: hypothetical protein VFN77_09975 [Acetobacteraceae bacterium]|nr:hypothetical protein [Acetobacteraceae bacterium]